jgi:transposase-like protein
MSQKTQIEKKPRVKRSKGPSIPKSDAASREARLRMAAILEVLGGQRTPTDAAQALGVSVAYYYKLEQRALEGMLKQCENPRKGPRVTPQREIAKLRKEAAELKQELHRAQALARASQRAVGLPKVKPPSGTDARGHRKRRPTARALKAAALLQESVRDEPAASQTASG